MKDISAKQFLDEHSLFIFKPVIVTQIGQRLTGQLLIQSCPVWNIEDKPCNQANNFFLKKNSANVLRKSKENHFTC
jgi:hypothetical protein